jgi:hypothetical protein
MTDGEIEWVKIKMKNQKDLLIGSFYMPHREQKHLDELFFVISYHLALLYT